MSFMFEVYYREPTDPSREDRLSALLVPFGGRLTFREEPTAHSVSRAVVLTYEFDDLQSAEKAAKTLQGSGERVDGSMDYGDD